MKNPIDHIVWRDVDELTANNYNPNNVFRPELKLLEQSILKTGWVQPILILEDGTIIDGFHRWSLSRDSKALRAAYQGFVPCAILDVPREEAMLLTVRMNRAKGTHSSVRMSHLVKELIDDHDLDPDEVAEAMGAHRSEVDLLYQEGVFKARKLDQAPYSKAWYPEETGK